MDGLPVFIRAMIKFEGYGLITDRTWNRCLEDVHVSPRGPECYRVSYNTYASRRLPRRIVRYWTLVQVYIQRLGTPGRRCFVSRSYSMFTRR